MDRTGGTDAAAAAYLADADGDPRAPRTVPAAPRRAGCAAAFQLSRGPAARRRPTTCWRPSAPTTPISPFPSTAAGDISPRAASTAGQRLSRSLRGSDRGGAARVRFDLAVDERAARRRRRPRLALSRARRRGIRALRRSGGRRAFSCSRRRVLQRSAAIPSRRRRGIGGPRREGARGGLPGRRRDNPLVGLEGRATLLRRLGTALTASPKLFGTPGRFGNLFDFLAQQATAGAMPASAILDAVLRGLGRSGRGGTCWAASISAMSGAIPPRAPRMPATATCRSTSSPSG